MLIAVQPRSRLVGLSGPADAALAQSAVTTALNFVPVIGTPLSLGISLISSLMGPGNNYPWVTIDNPDSLTLARQGEINPFARAVDQNDARMLQLSLTQANAAAAYWRNRWTASGGPATWTPSPMPAGPGDIITTYFNTKPTPADPNAALKHQVLQAQAEADFYRAKMEGPDNVNKPMTFYQAAFNLRNPSPPQAPAQQPAASPIAAGSTPFDFASLFNAFGMNPTAAGNTQQAQPASIVPGLSNVTLAVLIGLALALALVL